MTMFALTPRWPGAELLSGLSYECGFCGVNTSPVRGFYGNDPTTNAGQVIAAVCNKCGWLSQIACDERFPEASPGRDVPNLPETIREIYSEARDSFAAGAFTATSLTLRALLLHVAKNLGHAGPGGSFKGAVEFLVAEGHIAKKAEAWVDQLRVVGNAANHDLVVIPRADAEHLLAFMEYVLAGIYEHPARVLGTK